MVYPVETDVEQNRPPDESGFCQAHGKGRCKDERVQAWLQQAYPGRGHDTDCPVNHAIEKPETPERH